MIRKAAPKDVDAIIGVLKSTKLGSEVWAGDEKWARKALEECLDLKHYAFLVAEQDHKIVGFIDYCTFPSFWEGVPQGIINHLFVLPAFQGKDVGTMLLKAVIRQADAQGLSELHVSTERENIRARQLYAKHGFTEERLLLERTRK
jgi:ribosomal protein S18 acetylase RimI-like enzyme